MQIMTKVGVELVRATSVVSGAASNVPNLFCALLCGIPVVGLLLGSSLSAQISSDKPQVATTSAGTCASLVPVIPHADALRKVCEYALAVPKRMPDFTCAQRVSRYVGDQPVDVVTAVVAYENGRESYREVKANGKTVTDAKVLSAGTWSTGQFGADVQSIFHPGNQVTFEFVNEREIDGRSVLTFQYRVSRQDIPVWRLHMGDQVLAPPFRGQLRLDAATGSLLRLLVTATEIPHSYPMRTTDVDVKYDTISFGDRSSFVLPVASVVTGFNRKGVQNRNELEFSNCHKFRATTRVVPQE